ncbi:MAG: ribosome-associated translation inhibitor RaiA [Duncaniella sp.]|nr:ribosome-associated translation inhibitor RaiA [Muribaculum sp.]MCM1255349.1 ribosome-associated translation inhibitor RaiA [Duncaniella sp.]
MDINIKPIHFDISEKLTSFINKKIDKLVRRNPAINTAEVSLRVVKPETALNKQVTMFVLVPQDKIVAEKTADTFEEAVDLCVEAIEKQLEKYKDK